MMDTRRKLTVIWLCKFSNQELIDRFGTPHVRESSPWINGLIALFTHHERVDLHLVSPNVYNNKDLVFSSQGLTYHLYRDRPVWLSSKIDRIIRWNYRTDFRYVKRRIARIVDAVKPDIVHLHGAENAYYSAAILPLLRKYKILITIQGFVMDSSPEGMDKYLRRKRIEVEKIILSKGRHFGIDCDFMEEKISVFNPDAVFHRHQYPVTIPEVSKGMKDDPEKFDCVFFARICKDKGIEDLIQAISVVKKTLTSISLNVIGSVDSKYLNFLKNLCRELNIQDNITFSGFMATQELVFKEALKAKVSVLPTYHDTLPGTVVESMFLRIPVIAYNVGGLPELNRKAESIVLVDKGNVNDLASKIIQLLNNRELRQQLSDRAYMTIQQRIKPDDIIRDILRAYQQISLDATFFSDSHPVGWK